MARLKWTDHADLAITRRAEVGRSEYLDYMTFRRNDRPLFTEIFGPLIGLKEEWEAQGATPAELDFSAFRYRCEARAPVPVVTGRFGGHDEVLIEETDDRRIWRDPLGRTMMLSKGRSTLPLPMDYPVATMDDWLAIKPWYQYDDGRVAGDWISAARHAIADDRVVSLSIPGGFDEPRQLMGEEALCIAYYEQPELVRDILETIGETAVRVVERVTREVTVDVLFIHEDMAGRAGPLIGPKQVQEFLAPYYRRVWDVARRAGVQLFDQDSDGDMQPVLDAFLAAGVNCIHPVEPAANMDIVELRSVHGRRLAFYGGIDKHILRTSPKQITAELEYKIPPMVAAGGCVLGLDHRIPAGTPLDHYRFYIDEVWRILDREAAVH